MIYVLGVVTGIILCTFVPAVPTWVNKKFKELGK